MMAEDKKPIVRNFPVGVTTLLLTISQFSPESVFSVDWSEKKLTWLPGDLSPQTKVLNVSHNNISDLQVSDISFLSELEILILSHNRIQQLDLSVFRFNQDLEYLDLSHNQLWKLSCHPLVSLKHLDLSYNDFDALPICKEFGSLMQLVLSVTKLEQSDLLPIANDLHLNSLLVYLEGYYAKTNETESLQIPNTKKLHFIFHPNSLFSIRMNISVNILALLELTNIKLNDENCHVLMNFLSELTRGPHLVNMTMNRVETTWKCLVTLFQFLWPKPVEYLNIYSLTVIEDISEEYFKYSKTALTALTIEHFRYRDVLFSQNALYSVFSEMNIMMLTLTDTTFIHMLCPQKPSKFTLLNFTQNVFTDSIFENCSTLSRLETLILQKNGLKDLFKIGLMTQHMLSLEMLDVSRNSLELHRHEGNCAWAESIVVLDLSSNMLTDSVFRCLPPKVTVLDLHNNRIKSIPKDATSLDALEELNVAFNSLTDLPGCGRLSSLSVLIITNNAISQPSAKFFSSCQRMRSVKAGNNPFQCSCELRDFIKGISHMSSDVVEDWPESYKCDYPESYKKTALQDFHASELACNTTLLIVTIGISMLVLAALVTFVCVCFDLPWYLRMVCQWTQTRYRARNIPLEELQRNVQFHAFISYSGHDSAWVKNELLPNLEREGLRICLHERDFVAGKSIVENIINCTEQSYKSVFVLSPNFVQSEWCHYELYFAHHKLFHEGSHNLILILLDSIPQNSIPSKYHNLKALMAKRTYLEWPKEKSKHGLFWANVRAAFNTKLTLQLPNDTQGH
ncbi:toll-like receptor 6 [Echinops telfairi]|uniref:Toll-like receptor 6 n=1 Tax=Echinops telfairi TaxID=9371 RepID=A0AC55CP77_ECHTE|nr:toll-like receptor 6 [Echinops telfairi]